MTFYRFYWIGPSSQEDCGEVFDGAAKCADRFWVKSNERAQKREWAGRARHRQIKKEKKRKRGGPPKQNKKSHKIKKKKKRRRRQETRGASSDVKNRRPRRRPSSCVWTAPVGVWLAMKGSRPGVPRAVHRIREKKRETERQTDRHRDRQTDRGKLSQGATRVTVCFERWPCNVVLPSFHLVFFERPFWFCIPFFCDSFFFFVIKLFLECARPKWIFDMMYSIRFVPY